MKNIAYLFGAGASCNVLPLNEQIPKRISSCRSKLGHPSILSNISNHLSLEALLKDLSWLEVESANHASIDTYAKKLFLQKKYDELKRLKLAFSVFLTCEQIGKIPDKRYDAFLASIIRDDSLTLPNEFTICTWNYDHQLELAYQGFLGQSLDHVRDKLRCISKHHPWKLDDLEDKFCTLKLNGDSGLRTSDGGYYFFSKYFNGTLNAGFIEKIVEQWHEFASSKHYDCSNLTFAWEAEKESLTLMKQAESRLAQVQILVVIGYSFPFFNREIDRDLIEKMVDLNTVYIQAPDATVLVERFQSIAGKGRELEVIERHDTKQFWIPLNI